MIKYITIAVLLLLVAGIPGIFAQDYWYNTMGPGSGTIASVFIDTSGYIWTGSNGGEIQGSSDKGNSWVKLNNGLQGTNYMREILSDSAGHLFIGGTGGVWISSDSGQNWTRASNGITDDFIYSMAVDTNDVLFAGTYSKGIFKSTDYGQNWVLTSFAAKTSHVQDLAFSPVTGDLFAVTFYDGIYRSTDKGETWVKTDTGLVSTNFEAITIDSAGVLFAGSHEGIFISKDNGDHWNRAGLDSFKVLSLINFNGNLFAGTDRKGIYHSTDNGLSWQNTGLESQLIYALGVSRRDSIVYAASDYIYRSEKITTGIKPDYKKHTAFTLMQNYPNPFNPSTIINFELRQEGPVTLKVFNILGSEVATLINKNMNAGEHRVNFNAGDLAGGVYIYQLKAGSFYEARKMILVK